MPTALESVLRRDRLIVLGALGTLAVIAWALTARLALDMGWMMLGDGGWTAGYFTAMFLMWVVMMVGMMLPSAAPTILVYAKLQRSRAPHGGPLGSAALFTAGYLACWGAFSLLATLVQWGLAESALLASPMMIRATPALAGALFVAAGIYQLTPLKNACLGHCRSPLHFLMRGWRTGSLGAFAMGLENGAYCAGCCWALMALLFAVGAMNLLWVAAIAAFVLAEKLFPAGALIARAGAVLMLASGALLLLPV